MNSIVRHLPALAFPRELILIRHGESLRNHVKRGHVHFPDAASRDSVRDVPDHELPLTELGREQALVAGHHLRTRFGTPDAIHHSGYLRTIQTTEGILTAFPHVDIPIYENFLLRERDAGYMYDMLGEEIAAAFPWNARQWELHGSVLARPVGGESIADLIQRAYAYLTGLQAVGDERLVVVSHGGTMRALRFLIEGWPIRDADRLFRANTPPNCGFVVYRQQTNGTLALEGRCTAAPDVPEAAGLMAS